MRSLKERLESKHLTQPARAALSRYIPVAENLLLKAKEGFFGLGLDRNSLDVLDSWAAVEFGGGPSIVLTDKAMSTMKASRLRDAALAKLAETYPELVEQF